MSEIIKPGETKPERPSFSIIIPTYDDPSALAGTLLNIIYQKTGVRASLGDMLDIEREVIVVGDGYEEAAEKVVQAANDTAHSLGQRVKVHYKAIKERCGNGNIPRNAGLKLATKDWVMFIDTGTGVSYDCFSVLAEAAERFPELQLITWDMVSILQPAPIVSCSRVVLECDRSAGLPYVIPGNAAAVRREVAQKVDWPNVRESDWAYFSQLWETLFGKPGAEDQAKIDVGVGLIPWTMTIAYAYHKDIRTRVPNSMEKHVKSGYDKGWKPGMESNADTNTTG